VKGSTTISNLKTFAVIDLETTGFGKTDRILEIGVVFVKNGETLDEWETLVNPERDISNSAIHGITSTDVSLAPTFSEIAPYLANILDGKIFVAHNISFDSRILAQEFSRAGFDFDLGEGFCTLKATGKSLANACADSGIDNEAAHRALEDSRVTAKLLKIIGPNPDDFSPFAFQSLPNSVPVRVMCREAPKGEIDAPEDMVKNKHLPNIDDLGYASPQYSYADALYKAMSDFHLTQDERAYLHEWASAIGLDADEIGEVHQDYVSQLLHAANRDNFISDQEKSLVLKVAKELNVKEPIFESVNDEISRIVAGVKVCFTGSAFDSDGKPIAREYLEELAIFKGYVPVSSVTKKSCQLVVAMDISSMSGKTKKARDFGITVISVSEFLEM